MQILYKQATKQYIHYDASARRSDLVSDVNEATEMANDLAVPILNRCSKKLKGFESIPAESVKISQMLTFLQTKQSGLHLVGISKDCLLIHFLRSIYTL